MVTEGQEEPGIAEHPTAVHRDPAEETVPAAAIVQHLVLEGTDGRDLLLLHDVGNPPPHRRPRVVAKVVAVEAEDGLEQQVQLEGFDALGRKRRRSGFYRDSHTRSS